MILVLACRLAKNLIVRLCDYFYSNQCFSLLCPYCMAREGSPLAKEKNND